MTAEALLMWLSILMTVDAYEFRGWQAKARPRFDQQHNAGRRGPHAKGACMGRNPGIEIETRPAWGGFFTKGC